MEAFCDVEQFAQVRRSVVVNLRAISQVKRPQLPASVPADVAAVRPQEPALRRKPVVRARACRHAVEDGEYRMKQTAILVVASLLSILLLTLHITDDIVRGISKAEPSNTALLVLVVFLYGTLVLAERRSGHVIMLLVGLFAAGMPVIHMRGAHYSEIARSAGGFFFVWTLWALGGIGGLTFILSARGLWSLRRGQPR
jgi:hypothetical protein